MIYFLLEIYQNLKAHKWRSIFTGFGVMWALLIFVVLLSVGEGFRSGVVKRFAKYGENTMTVYSGWSDTGGPIKFNSHIVEQLARRFKFICHVSPYFVTSKSVMSFKHINELHINGVNNSFNKIASLEFSKGRFFTKHDDAKELSVCIINNQVAEDFFSKKNPIGAYLFIDKIGFKVIGILSKDEHNCNTSILISDKIFKKYFISEQGLQLKSIKIALQKYINPEEAEKKIRMFLARQCHFNLHDQHALYCWNVGKVFKKFTTFFDWLRISIWIVGLCFLFSGVVGISNMMLVVVKERTREIGIRKIVGATSKEILWMILLESVIVSLSNGIVGILGGMGTISIINQYLLRITQINPKAIQFIDLLTFQPSSAIASLLVLIIAGCLAGLLPAKKAITIQPIEALKTE